MVERGRGSWVEWGVAIDMERWTIDLVENVAQRRAGGKGKFGRKDF
jgi:hypothetical protein